MTFENSNVELKTFPGRGRGIVAACDIDAGEVILRAPVAVLNPMEFHMLRLMPAVLSYARMNGSSTDDGALPDLFQALEALVQDPDKVLSADQKQESADSAIMYTFLWEHPDGDGEPTAAIAFGLTSLCNHSSDQAATNAHVVKHIKDRQIDLVADRRIALGEEVLIRYMSTPFAEN